jgi:uncharacterized protein
MPPSAVPVRYARMRSLGFAWFLNILVGAAVGSAWLRVTPSGGGFLVETYLVAALFSTVATLAAIPALGLWVVGWILPSARVLGWLQAGVWTCFQLAIFADTRIYALYRYHFNGMVWNLLTTPGGQETIELGPAVWVMLALGAALLFALELAAWKRLFVRAPSA